MAASTRRTCLHSFIPGQSLAFDQLGKGRRQGLPLQRGRDQEHLGRGPQDTAAAARCVRGLISALDEAAKDVRRQRVLADLLQMVE